MKSESKRHVCPYCEEEIGEASLPFCQTCRIDILKCPRCGMSMSKEAELCPHCGADIRSELARGGD